MLPGRNSFVLLGITTIILSAAALGAQTPPAPLSARLEAAPAPAAPVSMASRDAEGHLVVRAIRLPEKLVLDGRLDESIYAQVEPAGGFLQAEPHFNDPATEPTEVWVFFDERAVYFGIRAFDSDPTQWQGLDMRRDTFTHGMNEHVTIAIDTFHDKRNGLLFGTNPSGAMVDTAVTNERDVNRDWNALWDARSARFDGGWSAEMEIPFKSLRYVPGDQTWGLNIRRLVKWKNEMSYLNQIPQGQVAMQGLQKFSSAATLVGLVSPAASPLLELKPYGITSIKTDRARDVSNKREGDLGFDAKYGLTSGLTADFTYNTDFAQVEDDEQQVNLSRFSLFFPEKRDFFLEGQGIFTFGGVAQRRGANPGEVPLPFFSRRVGLNDKGQAVPILGGGRLTGRAGAYSIGVVNIQTKQDETLSEPATNFSVFRVRRDILRRSNLGAVFVNRSAYGALDRSNQTYGIDGVFSFFQNVNFNTYIARTKTPELTGESGSYRTQFDYTSDRYGVVLERMAIGKHFNPEAGYVRRVDFTRDSADARFSPRPRASKIIRKFDFSGSFDRFVKGNGRLETRQIDGSFSIEFQSSDRLNLQMTDAYELLVEPFTVFGSVEIPLGKYRFRNFRADYNMGSQHKVAGSVAYEHGGYYGGIKDTVALSNGRMAVTPDFSIEPSISLNRIDMPQGTFVAKVASSRFFYTFNPRMFVGALMQYSSSNHSLSVNARLRWEYRPGSDLFVVYSDGRDTLVDGYPALLNRAFTVKITRFFRL